MFSASVYCVSMYSNLFNNGQQLGIRSLSVSAVSEQWVSVTAETNCSLTVPLSVTAVSGKTTFGRSLVVIRITTFIADSQNRKVQVNSEFNHGKKITDLKYSLFPICWLVRYIDVVSDISTGSRQNNKHGIKRTDEAGALESSFHDTHSISPDSYTIPLYDHPSECTDETHASHILA